MKTGSIRLFALATLASLAMASSANSATILIFGQQSNNDVVTSNTVAGLTTFKSGNGAAALPIPVTISNIGGVTPPAGTTLNETFSFTSSAPITGSGGNFSQAGFAGTFSYVPTVGAAQVIGTLTNGVLSTFSGANGTTGSFNSSNVTFTTLGAAILAQLGIPGIVPGVTGTFSLSLNGFVPPTVTNLNFVAQNSGLVTATAPNPIPEPASVVMASISVIAGLGCVGLRKFRAARA